MGRKEELIARLVAHPRYFTFDEVVALLGYLGFTLSNKGATSGSRIAFVHPRSGAIVMHRPHPGNVLKLYQIK